MAGQLEQAEGLYRAILQIDPNHHWANDHLMNQFLYRGRADLAVPYILGAAERNPTNPIILSRAAWALELSNNHAAAMALRNRALSALTEGVSPWVRAWATLKPGFDDWLHGDAASAAGQLSAFEARLNGSKAATDDELYFAASFYLGLGQLRKADSLLSRMINPRSNRDAARATVAFAANDLIGARKYMSEFLRHGLGPNSAMLLVHLGMIEEARRAVQRLQELSRGTRGEALGVQGELARIEGRSEDAIALLHRTMSTGQFAPETTYYSAAESLAEIWRDNHPAEAVRVLEEAAANGFRAYSWEEIGATPSYFWLRDKVRLVDLYRGQGRSADSRRLAVEVRKLLSVADADHPLLTELGRISP
jgi:tetratricopeptide (TPR) repeat protein